MLELSWILLRFATSFFLSAMALLILTVIVLLFVLRDWTPTVRPVGDQGGRAG